MRDCRCARFGTETSSSPPGREHAEQLGERPRLLLERQVLEHVEAQRAIERAVGETAAPSPSRARRARTSSWRRRLRSRAGRRTRRPARLRRSRRRARAWPAAARPDSAAPPRAWRVGRVVVPGRDRASGGSRRAPRIRRGGPSRGWASGANCTRPRPARGSRGSRPLARPAGRPGRRRLPAGRLPRRWRRRLRRHAGCCGSRRPGSAAADRAGTAAACGAAPAAAAPWLPAACPGTGRHAGIAGGGSICGGIATLIGSSLSSIGCGGRWNGRRRACWPAVAARRAAGRHDRHAVVERGVGDRHRRAARRCSRSPIAAGCRALPLRRVDQLRA